MFLTGVSAQDTTPWGDWWFENIGMSSLGGVRVTTDTAMQLSAVFRAVFLLSGHFAMLPLVLKREGSMKRMSGHWLQQLFKRPNAWQNGFSWRQMMMGHLLLRGNAYNQITTDRRGNIIALVPRHPDRVKIEMLPGGNYRYRVREDDGSDSIVTRGEMWHLRGLSSNGIFGLSVIECAAQSMGGALAVQAYAARFFANDAKPSGGWIKVPGKFADKAARDQYRESVQAAQGDANRGKIMVLDRDMEYHEVGVSNEQAQFLESRKFSIADVARWFGIPPHKLGDLEKSAFANIEQQALEYVTDGLLIWTETWEASVENDLLLDDEGIEVEFDLRKLLRGDSVARATYYHNGILDGWLTRNEAREDDGREPLEGLDEPLRPLNMIEEGAAEDAEGAMDSQEAPENEPQDGADADQAAKLNALLQSNAARLARRILKSNAFDVALVAEGLAITEGQAASFLSDELFACDLEQLTAALVQLGLTK